MTFSIMLWMPSWGGMINGLMTLSGAWDKLRTDPVLRMLVVVGRLLRHGDLRRAADVDQAGERAQPLHRLDHRPRAFRRARLGRLHQLRRALLPGAAAVEARAALLACGWSRYHFWIATIGIVLYITAMWVSGIMQGLMWRAYDELGFLQYSFVETVAAMHPYYVIRALGGVLFLIGALIMVYNLMARPRAATCREPMRADRAPAACRSGRVRSGDDVINVTSSIETQRRSCCWSLIADHGRDRRHGRDRAALHHREHDREGRRACAPTRRSNWPAATSTSARAATTATARDPAVPRRGRALRPLQPRRREHVRPPFQWGSKRTGPDLARVGGKYSNEWHVAHLVDPRCVVPESIMPTYAFLLERDAATTATSPSI